MRKECTVMIKTISVHREGEESSRALRRRLATGLSRMASFDPERDIE
jgi:hypothetical protein